MAGTILFIDDNEDIRNNVNELLTLSNYKVLLADNGKAGIEVAKKNHPDLIVCDVMMPDIDGWGVLHILKKDPTTEKIPFIYLTAKTEKIDFRTAIELGANDYLTKPFQTNELLNSIESVLRRVKKINTDERINDIEEEEKIEAFVTGAEDPLQALANECEVREYKKKDIIYKEGSTPRYLYYVNKGKIKTYKTHEDGKELVIDLYGENDYLGYQELLSSTTHNETAKTIDESEIVLIPKKSFEAILQNNPDVMKTFISPTRLLRKLQARVKHYIRINT